ncbi:MAG: hypothetical protein ABJO09_00045 [Hyphomicrobiales bacterium]|uniref:hypothetical protein n=1 Tax=Litoreibacter sp. TaxID=1969459 RepID=UPI00327B5B4C
MNYHIISSDASPARSQNIIDALSSLGFMLDPDPEEQGVHPEPVVIFWSKNTTLNEVVLKTDLEALAGAGRLISVLVEKVSLPDELPKHPVVDLVGWRGSKQNPFFQDLRAYLEAASQKVAPPPPRGPVVRLVQRLCAGLTVGVIIAFAFGFALNLLELQNNLCSIGFNQPTLSDFCGKYGLGDKPTRDERVAWEAREPGSCDALRAHIDTFGETGTLHDRAAAMLDARRVTIDERWVKDVQRTIFSQSITSQVAPTEQAARLAALDSAQRVAEASCRAFSESDLYRYAGFDVQAESWDCLSLSDGHYCGFDGERLCNLERVVRTEVETCGQ